MSSGGLPSGVSHFGLKLSDEGAAVWARARCYLRTPRSAFSLLPGDNPGARLFVVLVGPVWVLFGHQGWVEHPDSLLWQVLAVAMVLGGSAETALFLLWLMRPLRDGERERIRGR